MIDKEAIEQLMNNNAKLLQGLDKMRSYIESPKFKRDTTVNKNDEQLMNNNAKLLQW